jgi:hypothetical protein
MKVADPRPPAPRPPVIMQLITIPVVIMQLITE